MTTYELVQSLAIRVNDENFQRQSANYYLFQVNKAQQQICIDLGLNVKLNTGTTVAEQRSYTIEVDLGITDFLAIDHIKIDGYDVKPIEYEYYSLDYVSEVSGGPSGLKYLYKPGVRGGSIYFEPIPADAWTMLLWYIGKLETLSLSDNTTWALGDQYAELLEAKAASYCYPFGSKEATGAIEAYSYLLADKAYEFSQQKGGR